MPLETATYIHDLVASNPAHTDGLNQGDAHLRLLKSVLQAQFPNFTSVALNSTEAQIDAVANGTQALFGVGSVSAPSVAFSGDTDSGFYKAAEDNIALSLNGVQQLSMTTSAATFAQPVVGPANSGLVPAGSIVMFQGGSPPTGWAWCNGGTVPSASNPNLNAIYGNTGGNITLPDWRSLFPVGKQNMGGTDRGVYSVAGLQANINTMNSVVGEAYHTLTIAELAAHNHSASDSGHGHSDAGHGHGFGYSSGNVPWTVGTGGNTGLGGGSNTIEGDGSFFISTGFANIQTGFANISIGNNGSGAAHNIMNYSLVTGFIIKLG